MKLRSVQEAFDAAGWEGVWNWLCENPLPERARREEVEGDSVDETIKQLVLQCQTSVDAVAKAMGDKLAAREAMNQAAQELLFRIAEYLMRNNEFCERVGDDVRRGYDRLSDQERGGMYLQRLIDEASSDDAKGKA